MLEALSKTHSAYRFPVLLGASLALPFAFYFSGMLQSLPQVMALALALINGLLLTGLFVYLAAKSVRKRELREDRYVRIIRLAFFPWLIASIGASIGSIELAKQPIDGQSLSFLQFDVALNFCLSLTLFVLFASMQVKERERQPINFQKWLAPLVLFFVLGILQFLNFRHGNVLDSFSTVAGVSALVAALNAAIAWQLSAPFSRQSRRLFLLAVGLHLLAHVCVLAHPNDSTAVLVFRHLAETIVIALLFGFHRQLSLCSDGYSTLSARRSKAALAEDMIRPLQTVMAYGDVLREDLANSLQFSASL
jgi:hypothetical protein